MTDDTLDRFGDLVADPGRYVGSSHDGIWDAALQDPAVRLRLRESLTDLLQANDREIRRTNDQIRRFPKDRSAQNERARAVDFKDRLVARIKQTKSAIADASTPAGTYGRTVPYQTLVYAIIEHRRASQAGGYEPEPHDLALWAILDYVADSWLAMNVPTAADLAARADATR